MKKKKCLRCGHEWMARIEKPRYCPRCRSIYWDVPKEGDEKVSECEIEPIRNYGEVRRMVIHAEKPDETMMNAYLARPGAKEAMTLVRKILNDKEAELDDSSLLEFILRYVPDSDFKIINKIKIVASNLTPFGMLALALEAKGAAILGNPECVGCLAGCGLGEDKEPEDA